MISASALSWCSALTDSVVPSPNQREDERHIMEAGFVLISFANACSNPASKEPNPSREYAVDILSDALAVDVYRINTDRQTVIKHYNGSLRMSAVIAHHSRGRGYAGRRRRRLRANQGSPWSLKVLKFSTLKFKDLKSA